MSFRGNSPKSRQNGEKFVRKTCGGAPSAVLPGGGGDDELLHTADHNPDSRRHDDARGRFDRGVPPARIDPTQGGGFPVATLYTSPGNASDPPPHRRPVLLATDGQGHYTDGQGLPTVPAGQGPQTRTPATNRDTSTSPPFRPPPRGPGRAAAAFARPHLPVRPDIEMAGGHPSRLHNRRRLRQGPLRRLGITLRSTSHHHFRQRAQFTSALWAGLCSLLNIQHSPTTAYHPQSNGLVVGSTGLLKDALRSGAADWRVLLGIRTAFREDSEFSPAEAVYGSQLVLPGQFINTAELPSPSFLRELQTTMTGRPPPPARHNAAPALSALPEELLLARFVLVRRDGARPPLSPIYDGPYRVLERSAHFFLLEMGDRTDKVSTLHLKAARTPADT
jgi:hypothetical protein